MVRNRGKKKEGLPTVGGTERQKHTRRLSEMTRSQLEGILHKQSRQPDEASLGVTEGMSARSSLDNASSNKQKVDDDTMVVGKGIMIKGEVDNCGALIVDGHFEGVFKGERLTVCKGGKYVGSADVQNADVGGRLQGTLHARSLLEVRSSGRVEGTIQYTSIQTEPGGLVVGDVQGVDNSH